MIQFLPFLVDMMAKAAPMIAETAPAAASAAFAPTAAAVTTTAANPLLGVLAGMTGAGAMQQGWGQMTGPVEAGVKPWQQRTAGALNVGRGAGQMYEAIPKAQPSQPVQTTVQTQMPQGWRQMTPVASENVDDTLRRLYPHIFA